MNVFSIDSRTFRGIDGKNKNSKTEHPPGTLRRAGTSKKNFKNVRVTSVRILENKGFPG
jgi:hypothetical protein